MIDLTDIDFDYDSPIRLIWNEIADMTGIFMKELDGRIYCPLCMHGNSGYNAFAYNYCPECGAKMERGDRNA